MFQEVGRDEIAVIIRIRGDHLFQVKEPEGRPFPEVMHELLQYNRSVE